MALLAGTCYDPTTAVSVATSSLTAMTALDTTNLRLTFTAPASGNVLVRLRSSTTGATTAPGIFLGVLDGATVKLRMSPMGQRSSGVATELIAQECVGLVTGLTPGNSYTWDAAMSVDVVLAATNLVYGGPDNNSGGNAYGGFVFEVWDTTNLLAGTCYDPGSSTGKITTSLIAMTVLDTTNLRLTVTAPASGKVMWRIRTTYTGSGTQPVILLGVLEGGTLVGRSAPLWANPASVIASTKFAVEASGIIALSAGSHVLDAAVAVQVVSGASGAVKWGGANDTTSNNAWGGIAYEIWTA